MGEFIHAQMLYHAKALEMYTLAFQHTQAIEESEQLDVSIDALSFKAMPEATALCIACVYTSEL